MRKLLLLALLCFCLKPLDYCEDLKDVKPRIFTPNGDGYNDVVFFEYEDKSGGLIRVELVIFDVNGREVRSLSPTTPQSIGVNKWRFSWDGKDKNGEWVFPGVYIYRLKIGEKVYSGTIIAAK